MELPPPVADVADAFADTVQTAYAGRPHARFRLVLSGGPTARLCYERLADDTNRTGAIDWSLVDIYMGDERYVPPDDDDANQRLVREALIERLTATVGSFTPMPTTLPVDECVRTYQVAMQDLIVRGDGIDLIHLGLGPDGHTASLFPHASTLQADDETLVASTEDPNGVNPHPRLTLTLPAINRARQAVFTVSGPAKAKAVAALRRGEDIPAARVRVHHIFWLLDAAASGTSP